MNISVYEHQIVVWNSGRLPENWTLGQLLDKHPSSPYNPLLAATLFRAGYIEAWGRGIEKMAMECAKFGMKPPLYDDMAGLMLTFRASRQRLIEALGEERAALLTQNWDNAVGDGDNKVGDGDNKVGDGDNDVGNGGNKVGDGGDNRGGDGDNRVGDAKIKRIEIAAAILASLRQTPGLSIRAIAARLYVSARQVETLLAHLKAQGQLVRLGSGRRGFWQVAGGQPVAAPGETQAQILILLRTKPNLTASQLAGQLGISVRKTEQHLAKLKISGRLLRLGTPRSGHWQVVEPD